jgi:hypothetical protein
MHMSMLGTYVHVLALRMYPSIDDGEYQYGFDMEKQVGEAGYKVQRACIWTYRS